MSQCNDNCHLYRVFFFCFFFLCEITHLSIDALPGTYRENDRENHNWIQRDYTHDGGYSFYYSPLSPPPFVPNDHSIFADDQEYHTIYNLS